MWEKLPYHHRLDDIGDQKIVERNLMMKRCYYPRPGDGPWGVMFMVVDEHVVRADVQSRPVPTIEGAHLLRNAIFAA
jgi:hypothetical protein